MESLPLWGLGVLLVIQLGVWWRLSRPGRPGGVSPPPPVEAPTDPSLDF